MRDDPRAQVQRRAIGPAERMAKPPKKQAQIMLAFSFLSLDNSIIFRYNTNST